MALHRRSLDAAGGRYSTGRFVTADGDTDDLVDFSQIDALIEVAGAEGVNEILRAFWRSTDELSALLKAQLGGASLADASRTAHAVKGSAANVGANLLSNAAKDIEGCCKAGDAAGAAAALRRLETAYEQTRGALTAHVAKAA